MKPQDANRIGVLGFGTMGHTWVAALLTGDLEVYVFEQNKETIDNNRGRIKKYLQRLVEKGKWPGDVDATMARLHFADAEQGHAPGDEEAEAEASEDGDGEKTEE